MSNDKFITLEQLTRTVKGLVNKVNAESSVIDEKIGDLTNLTTSNKTNLVTAINEINAGGGSSGSSVTYSLSMTGNRITLTPSSGTATYVDLPIYNGGVSS